MKKRLHDPIVPGRFFHVFWWGAMVAVLATAFLYDARGIAQQRPVREMVLLSGDDVNNTAFNYCDTGGTNQVICSTGTAAGDGWILVAGESKKSVQIDVDTLGATSAEFIIQARNSGGSGSAAQIWPATGDHSVTGSEDPISIIQEIPDSVYQIRIGYKVTGSTAGTEVISIVYNSFAQDQR